MSEEAEEKEVTFDDVADFIWSMADWEGVHDARLSAVQHLLELTTTLHKLHGLRGFVAQDPAGHVLGCSAQAHDEEMETGMRIT